MMPPPYHGSCLCREIEFEINSEHILVTCCHCKNCKKFTGTVFTSNVVFPGADLLRFTKGENLVSTYSDPVQDTGNVLVRKFCSKCGASLYTDRGDGGRTLAVFYSALDDFDIAGDDGIAKDARPQVEYYSRDRISWVHPVEGAEQPKTKPGRD